MTLSLKINISIFYKIKIKSSKNIIIFIISFVPLLIFILKIKKSQKTILEIIKKKINKNNVIIKIFH